jgi:hypothetical protein
VTLPKVLIASPIRYRPDCPEVLPAFLDALAALDWPEERVEFCMVVHDPDDGSSDWRDVHQECERLGYLADVSRVFVIGSTADTRTLGGPRTTGETLENLAFLRNKILRRFQESDADLLLMVDSDVVLAPGALRAMFEAMAWHSESRPLRASNRGTDSFQVQIGDGSTHDPCTVTAQIDNRLAIDHPPASNGQTCENVNETLHYLPAPYAIDGTVIEVARAGACTLYPRSVLARRFRWDPRYTEEHQALFDDLRELGFRHYLIRAPELAEHRRDRWPSGFDLLRQNREERERHERENA